MMQTRASVRRERRANRRGIALVTVLFVLALLLGIGAALHTGVISETTARGAHLRATTGFYAAEAGINRGMGDYRNIFLNYNIPSGTDFAPHSFTIDHRTVSYQLSDTVGNPFQVLVPAGRLFAGLNATEYRYSVNSTSQLVTGDNEATIGTKFNVDYIPIFQFLAFYQGDLEIMPGADALFHGPIHTNGDLYLNSNATLTICDCLTTGSNPCPAPIPTVHLSAAGNVYRGRKDDTSQCTGTVKIAKLVDSDHNGALDLQTMSCGSGTTQESSSTLATWLGSILSRQTVVSVPAPGIIARGAGGDYWQRADLRIVLDLTAPDNGRFPIVVQDVNGAVDAKNASLQAFFQAKPGRLFYSDVPDSAKRNSSSDCTNPADNTYCSRKSYNPNFTAQGDVYACPTTDLNLYTSCGSYIANLTLSSGQRTARRGGFYNNREHDWVYMLNLDLHDLLAWNRAQGGPLFDPNNTSEGGVILYLSVVGPGSNITCSQTPAVACSSPRYGVRVFGTPNLDFPPGMTDPTGVTVVSDQAIYVEGTYNTGTGSCSSGGAGTCPKMPAAFMGDSLNVLSGNWSGSAAFRNDAQSFQPLASRPAAATTIYAAFLAGVDVTRSGAYNGGFENYPRFHESWSNIQFFYRGSFVSLGMPQHSNGAWCGTGGTCNIYDAPTRNWDFDTDFQDASKLPPATPRFVTVQQILFTENFR